MPKPIVARAKDILSVLSEQHAVSGGLEEKMSKVTTETAVPCDQLSLFPEDETFTEIKRILQETDLNRCTPIQALTILSDLKRLLQ